MSKQNPEKSRLVKPQRKKHQDKPFVQVEGELTEAQLDAIAGGKLSQN